VLPHHERNTPDGAARNISRHYALSNELFELFLDETMAYSCAIFEPGDDLESAQRRKYDAVCDLALIGPDSNLLEIGSGWGGNAIYMAKHYGCKVTSLTISAEQHKMAVERVEAAGLSDRISILMQDYRLMEGEYDKIVSVEMLEAVGHNYLDLYFKKCHELLKKNGILALQVITSPDSRYDSLRKGVDWIQKYIFPGSLLPSVGAINSAINRTGDLTMVDLKDMGLHYATTLKLWFDQFNANLPTVKSLGFDEEFIRKWNYYLCYCEAAFAMRNINVMQLVYSRPNNVSR